MIATSPQATRTRHLRAALDRRRDGRIVIGIDQKGNRLAIIPSAARVLDFERCRQSIGLRCARTRQMLARQRFKLFGHLYERRSGGFAGYQFCEAATPGRFFFQEADRIHIPPSADAHDLSVKLHPYVGSYGKFLCSDRASPSRGRRCAAYRASRARHDISCGTIGDAARADEAKLSDRRRGRSRPRAGRR